MADESENRPGENTDEICKTIDQIVDGYLNSQGLTRDDIEKFKAAKKQALDDSQMAEKARVTDAERVALEAEMADPTSNPDQLFLIPEDKLGIGEDESSSCDDNKVHPDCGDIIDGFT